MNTPRRACCIGSLNIFPGDDYRRRASMMDNPSLSLSLAFVLPPLSPRFETMQLARAE